jgi:hypothetical protein
MDCETQLVGDTLKLIFPDVGPIAVAAGRVGGGESPLTLRGFRTGSAQNRKID